MSRQTVLCLIENVKSKTKALFLFSVSGGNGLTRHNLIFLFVVGPTKFH